MPAAGPLKVTTSGPAGVAVLVGVGVLVFVAVGVGVLVFVAVGVGVLVLVAVGVGVSVAVAVGVGVSVAVAVGVGVSVAVAVGVGVSVAVAVGVGVSVFVAVGVGVSVFVAVGVGVSVFVAVGVGVSVFVAVAVGVFVAVAVAVGVFVGVAVPVLAVGVKVLPGLGKTSSICTSPPPPQAAIKRLTAAATKANCRWFLVFFCIEMTPEAQKNCTTKKRWRKTIRALKKGWCDSQGFCSPRAPRETLVLGVFATKFVRFMYANRQPAWQSQQRSRQRSLVW